MTREEELQELEYREQKKVVVVRRVNLLSKCKCPTCDKGLNEFDRFDYCPYCGQKLDWERTFDY